MTGALPNFLIIGAQKAGTTTLYHLLRRHPAIFMPSMKEPGFFIRGFPDPIRFQTLLRPDDGRTARPVGSRGGGCYTLEDYRALFDPGAAAPIRGEASTPYLPSPYAARRIAELLPDARLIVVLRDPVERAFSAYNYNLSRGMEPARTFEDAMASELRGERDDWVYGWRYLYTGRYAEHLQRYFDLFPREHVAVLRFEELRDNARGLLAHVYQFLGAQLLATPANRVDENRTILVTNPVLQFAKAAATRSGPLKRIARGVAPRGLRGHVGRRILRMVDRFGDRPAPMPASIEIELRAYFQGPNRELAGLLETDLGDWDRPTEKRDESDSGD